MTMLRNLDNNEVILLIICIVITIMILLFIIYFIRDAIREKREKELYEELPRDYKYARGKKKVRYVPVSIRVNYPPNRNGYGNLVETHYVNGAPKSNNVNESQPKK